MTKFTCELTKPSHTIAFHNGSKQVGLLDFNGPVMTFEGDADESAKVFFDFIAERFAQFKKREWVGLTADDLRELRVYRLTPRVSHEDVIDRVEAKLKEKNA